MLNVINISLMNNFTTIQKLGRTPENIHGQQTVFQGSRTSPVLYCSFWRKVLGALGRLEIL